MKLSFTLETFNSLRRCRYQDLYDFLYGQLKIKFENKVVGASVPKPRLNSPGGYYFTCQYFNVP